MLVDLQRLSGAKGNVLLDHSSFKLLVHVVMSEIKLKILSLDCRVSLQERYAEQHFNQYNSRYCLWNLAGDTPWQLSCSSPQLKNTWSSFFNWERKNFKTACKVVREDSLMNLFGFAAGRFPSESVILSVIYSAHCWWLLRVNWCLRSAS